jgi:hypothetical protein
VGNDCTFAGGGSREGESGRGGTIRQEDDGKGEDVGGRAVLGYNVTVKNQKKEMGMVTHVSGRRTRTLIDTGGENITSSVDFWPWFSVANAGVS